MGGQLLEPIVIAFTCPAQGQLYSLGVRDMPRALKMVRPMVLTTPTPSIFKSHTFGVRFM